MINHQDWQDQIPFYVAQSLSPEQVRSFESHLATCKDCQAEISDWRMIASAVWRDTDEVARQLPPLSQEVYNRLSYRDKLPVSRYAANPPRPQAPQSTTTALPPNVTVLPKQRRVQLPITMVAGLVVAVLFGGILLMFALRDKAEQEVALLDTPNALSSEEAGVQPDVSSTPTDLAIIPTLDPNFPTATVTNAQGTGDFATNTPNPPATATRTLEPSPETFEPTQNHEFTMVSSPMPPSPEPTHTQEPVAPLGGGPYITITPGIYSEGAAYCEIFNPSTVGIEVYESANWNSQIVGIIAPNQNFRVLNMSAEGWYSVFLPNIGQGWISGSMAYLRGSCYAGYDLPFATTTVSSEAIPTDTPNADYEAASGRIVVINAAYADLQSEPNFSSSIMGVVSRDEQFPVLGYQGTGSNRFVNVLLPDGRSAWISAQIVIDYAANEAPPAPTQQ